MVHEPRLTTERALGRSAAQVVLAKLTPVPLSIMPEKGLMPQRSEGCPTCPGLGDQPGAADGAQVERRVSDRRRVPSTRMLSWLAGKPGVLYGKDPIRPVAPPVPYWRVAPRVHGDRGRVGIADHDVRVVAARDAGGSGAAGSAAG